jgi:hypothetical protein
MILLNFDWVFKERNYSKFHISHAFGKIYVIASIKPIEDFSTISRGHPNFLKKKLLSSFLVTVLSNIQ